MTNTNETLLDELDISAEEMENARNGIFKKTLLERWDYTLQSQINATLQPISLEIASDVLNTYPWLKHQNLPSYREDRMDLLLGAKRVLRTVLDEAVDTDDEKTRELRIEQIFSENEDDWIKHKDLYLQTIAGWNKLIRDASEDWSLAMNNDHLENIESFHAAILDVAALLLNEGFGLLDGLRQLKDFEHSEETAARLAELMEG